MSNLFARIENDQGSNKYSVIVSIAEIYKESIKDLLDPAKTNLRIVKSKSRGTIIKDVTEYLCADELEVFQLLDMGNRNRAVASNRMNQNSSRSHTILTITILMTSLIDGTSQNGKLHLVDLAGSERVSKTGVKGKMLAEAKSINQSLSTLGRLINAFNDPAAGHIPYRESKLTRILADSLGGNSKTCMIVTVSPHPQNRSETLSTLRYGSRA